MKVGVTTFNKQRNNRYVVNISDTSSLDRYGVLLLLLYVYTNIYIDQACIIQRSKSELENIICKRTKKQAIHQPEILRLFILQATF